MEKIWSITHLAHHTLSSQTAAVSSFSGWCHELGHNSDSTGSKIPSPRKVPRNTKCVAHPRKEPKEPSTIDYKSENTGEAEAPLKKNKQDE